VYLGNRRIWLNTDLWRRLPQRVREILLAFLLCAESEEGILNIKRQDLEWSAKQEDLKWALSWLTVADLAHYCNCRYYLNPTLSHDSPGTVEKRNVLEKWAALTSIPF